MSVTKPKSREAVIADGLTVLAECHRDKISPITIQAYCKALEDLPIPAIERAFTAAMRAKWFPKAFELRELCGESSNEDRAQQAWLCADQAALRYGPYVSINFDCPVINATIRSLGDWVRFTEVTGKDREFLRGSFLKTYASFAKSGVNGDACAHLVGLSERSVATASQIPEGWQPRMIEAKSGLPALPNCKPIQPRLNDGKRADVPRLELKKA